MTDIVPELWEKIRKEFEEAVEKDGRLKEIRRKIEEGTATYEDALEYSQRIGKHCSDALKVNITIDILPDGKMYFNIADRTVRPAMEMLYELDADICQKVQAVLNKNAGIGMKPIPPNKDSERISDIIDKLTEYDDPSDGFWLLDEPVQNYSQHIVDNSVKKNAEFHYKAGLSPKIVRQAVPGCCGWCQDKEGEYEYPKVGKEIYQRHKNCNCLVTYTPGNGKYQDVHNKSTWYSTEEERDETFKRLRSEEIEKKKKGKKLQEEVEIKRIREQVIPNLNIDTIVKRQEIHRQGTKLFEARKKELEKDGKYGPSYVTITDDEIKELVKVYAGKGEIKLNKNGEWVSNEMILGNDKIIGVVVNDLTGATAETTVFKIHYGKDGVHIVPDYPSKKRGKK